MATVCKKCGGIIPDIHPLGIGRNDCKYHHKSDNILKPFGLKE